MPGEVGLLQPGFGHCGFGVEETGELGDEDFSFGEEVCDLRFGGQLFGGGFGWDVGCLGVLGVGVEEGFGLQLVSLVHTEVQLDIGLELRLNVLMRLT